MTTTKGKVDWTVLDEDNHSEDESKSQQPTQPKHTQQSHQSDLLNGLKSIDAAQVHLFVGGVHYDATESHLIGYYKDQGVQVLQIKSLGKGAFIMVVTREDAYKVAKIYPNVLLGRQFNVKLSNKPLNSRYGPGQGSGYNNEKRTYNKYQNGSSQQPGSRPEKSEAPNVPPQAEESELVKSMKGVTLNEEHLQIIKAIREKRQQSK